MPTECIADLFGFEPVERRRIEASFDGGQMTSDAGGLLLGMTARAIGLIEHELTRLVGQRIYGIALGY